MLGPMRGHDHYPATSSSGLAVDYLAGAGGAIEQLGVPARTDCGRRRGSELEDDTGRHLAGQHVVDGLVDCIDLAVHRNHLGPSGGVQGEDVSEVVAGAYDRADDGLAADHRVEDRQVE